MPDRPSLAVIVVSYNVRDQLAACLMSLASSRDEAGPMSVTVVDNGSSDGTVAMLRGRWPAVQLIVAETNLGFARANNRGVRHTPGDVVLLLNPDTVVAPGAIAALVEALISHPEAAAAGPRLVDAAGRAELSFGWAVSPLGEWRQQRLMTRYANGVGAASRRIEQWTQAAGPRKWLSAACLLVRRVDFDAVGGFDERYFMYYEDVDLCVTLGRRGRAILFVPTATVQHLRGQSGSSHPDLARRRRESQVAYYQKHHPFWVPLLRWYVRLRSA